MDAGYKFYDYAISYQCVIHGYARFTNGYQGLNLTL